MDVKNSEIYALAILVVAVVVILITSNTGDVFSFTDKNTAVCIGKSPELFPNEPFWIKYDSGEEKELICNKEKPFSTVQEKIVYAELNLILSNNKTNSICEIVSNNVSNILEANETHKIPMNITLKNSVESFDFTCKDDFDAYFYYFSTEKYKCEKAVIDGKEINNKIHCDIEYYTNPYIMVKYPTKTEYVKVDYKEYSSFKMNGNNTLLILAGIAMVLAVFFRKTNFMYTGAAIMIAVFCIISYIY